MRIGNIENVLHNMFLDSLQDLVNEYSNPVSPTDSRNEKELNRCLLRKIRTRLSPLIIVLIECPIQPGINDKHPLSREEKKPDITLIMKDNENKDSVYYHVECKRLSKPPSHYCSAYIKNGIKRFIDPHHGYGCFTDLGFMIGYLQDISIGHAFDAVNDYAEKNNIPPLEKKNGTFGSAISTLEHMLSRQQAFPAFRLKHYWAKTES